MGDCVSKDDCTHLCDDEYSTQFQRPHPLDPQAGKGFTFAAPAQGTKLVLGAQPYYRAPPPAAVHLGSGNPSNSAASHSPSPPRVPVPPPVVTDAADAAPGTPPRAGAVSREPFDDASSDPAAPPSKAKTEVARSSSSSMADVTTRGDSACGGSNGGSDRCNGSSSGTTRRTTQVGGDCERLDRVDAISSAVGEQQSAPTKTKKGVTFAAAEAPAIRVSRSDCEKDEGDDAIRTHARTVRVIGGSNFVHMMAFVAQYVVPAIHGPLLRLTVRNECQASLAIGVVPLAHAAQLYGPNRYLYDWRSPEVGGGGVTLWAQDHATPFGIFDFAPSSSSRGRTDPMYGLCVKGSLVTLELDVAARVVRLLVSVPGGKRAGRNRSAGVRREITGTIRPHTVEVDTPLIFVVAPMCKGDAVTIVPD